MSIPAEEIIGELGPGMRSPRRQPTRKRADEAARKAMTGKGTIPRYGGILFAVAATMGLVFFLALPAPSNDADASGVLATVAAAYLVALFLLSAAPRMGTWAIQPVTACGTLLISAGIYFLGDPQSSVFMFYLSVVLFSAYFFKRSQVILQLVLVGVCYGAVLLALDPNADSLSRWIIVGSWMVTVGALVGLLKARIAELVGRLAEAARTDSLTGLLNRRGFEERFELELERARRHGRTLSLLMGDLDYFKEVNDRLGHHVGDSALKHVGAVLEDTKRRTDIAGRLGGEEFALIVTDTDEAGGYSLAERLRSSVRHACADKPAPLTISIGVASHPSHGDTAESLLHAADRALYAAKALGRDRSVIYSAEVAGTIGAVTRRERTGDSHLATVLALAETLDIRDSGTARHSQTVGRYAEMTARELGLPSDAVERIRLAGILHDVGKIGVPDSVLRKPGPLTDEEWEEMRKHPEIGARILENADLDDIREWVLAHQESPNGRGYPRGLKAEEIPLGARIVAVADAYEAMTSNRVYRSALGHEAAQAELIRCADAQFDGHVVDALLRALEHEALDQGASSLQETAEETPARAAGARRSAKSSPKGSVEQRLRGSAA